MRDAGEDKDYFVSDGFVFYNHPSDESGYLKKTRISHSKSQKTFIQARLTSNFIQLLKILHQNVTIFLFLKKVLHCGDLSCGVRPRRYPR